MKEENPFSINNLIKANIELTEEQIKIYTPYLTNRMYYYSGYEKQANILNLLWNTTKEYQYRLSCSLFKGLRIGRWIKKEKEIKYNDIVISYIKKKYKCSTKIAMEYYKLLNNDEIKEIKKYAG